MTTELLLGFVGLAAIIVISPIVYFLCEAVLEYPWVGAVVVPLLAIAAYRLFPNECAVDEHCGFRLAWLVFGVLCAVAAAVAIAMLAGFARRSRARPRSGLPAARVHRK
jgi:hypothetical protein